MLPPRKVQPKQVLAPTINSTPEQYLRRRGDCSHSQSQYLYCSAKEQFRCPRKRQLLHFSPIPPEMQIENASEADGSRHALHAEPAGGRAPARVTKIASRSCVRTPNCSDEPNPQNGMERKTGARAHLLSRVDRGCCPVQGGKPGTATGLAAERGINQATAGK